MKMIFNDKMYDTDKLTFLCEIPFKKIESSSDSNAKVDLYKSGDGTIFYKCAEQYYFPVDVKELKKNLAFDIETYSKIFGMPEEA